MDWKKRHYFQDSTAYSTGWETTGGIQYSAGNGTDQACGSTIAANTTIQYMSNAITTYITKAQIIHDNLATFHVYGGAVGYTSTSVYGSFVSYEETAEQKAARQELEQKYAEEVKKADHKARLLFIKIAGRKFYRLLKKNNHFDVVGRSGQRYRLAIGEKVRVMRGCFGDEVLHKLCAYVPDVPAVDTLLAQYLALTSSKEDETEFAKIAIKHAA